VWLKLVSHEMRRDANSQPEVAHAHTISNMLCAVFRGRLIFLRNYLIYFH
jgi:hypothetical protein